MHVLTHRFKISVAATVHHDCLIPSAENVPGQPVPTVESRCICSQEPLHSFRQVRSRCFDHQMKMVAHQVIRMHLPAGLDTCLAKRCQKTVPVRVAKKYGLPPVPTVHHVVDSPRILHPQFPPHPAIKISLTTFVNSSFLFPLIQTSKDQLLQIVGTDPNGPRR